MYVVGALLEGQEDSEDIFDRIESYREENDVFLQLFDQSKVIGKEHLKWAHKKAEETFEQGTNRANDLEIETLLWASGEWQIKDALDKMGIEGRIEKVAVLIDENPDKFLDQMKWSRNDEILEPTKEKLKAFGVTENEISSVDKPHDLVFEKMAASIL